MRPRKETSPHNYFMLWLFHMHSGDSYILCCNWDEGTVIMLFVDTQRPIQAYSHQVRINSIWSCVNPPPTCLSSSRALVWVQRLHVPDALRILVDAPVTAEEPHAGHAGDALAEPLVLVLVGLVHQRLCLDVAVEVVGHQVVVAVVLDRRGESAECIRIPECALLDLFEDPRKVRVQRVAAVVVCVPEILDILGQVAKEEDVVLSNLTGDFNLALSAGFQKRRGTLHLRHHMCQ